MYPISIAVFTASLHLFPCICQVPKPRAGILFPEFSFIVGIMDICGVSRIIKNFLLKRRAVGLMLYEGEIFFIKSGAY